MYNKLYSIISKLLFDGNPQNYAYGEIVCKSIPILINILLLFIPILSIIIQIKLLGKNQ